MNQITSDPFALSLSKGKAEPVEAFCMASLRSA
ncbi:hypothetical protein M527_00950 [Sphingobium indicum IP26]|nr:hypothetical protein M527_00950 [Sphingobium indicum IP26]EQA97176.1 hypothetical protein L286_22880 [Sphingobium sp. HDIP04]